MSTRLQRLVGIDALIRSGGYPNLDTLCQLFEVQPRTVYHDLRELRELFHLDIRFDRSRNGYYNANPQQRLPRVGLDEDQTLLVALAIHFASNFVAPPMLGSLSGFIDLLAENLSPDDGLLNKMSALFKLEHMDRAGPISATKLLPIAKALIRGQKLVLELTRGKLHDCIPQHLLMREDGWFLIARSAGTDHTLNLDDILAIHAT